MKNIFAITTALFLTFLFSSCGRKLTFETSPVVPAAHGKVKIKKDNNNNYIITVNVVNLADSKNLTPPKNVYVVWMESTSNRAKNIGQINTSSGLLSSTLKGELKATATTKPNRIFITAEDDGNIQFPGTQMVLRTE